MDESRYSVGDVVELKCGGCKMVVREYDKAAPKLVSCYWHDFAKGEPQSQWYLEDMLRPA